MSDTIGARVPPASGDRALDAYSQVVTESRGRSSRLASRPSRCPAGAATVASKAARARPSSSPTMAFS